MGIWNIPFYGIIFGTGYLAFLFIRRANRRGQLVLQYSLVAPVASNTELRTEEHPGIRQYLLHRAAILCAITSRAAGELAMGTSQVASGDATAVRAAVNQVLRARGLWNHLESEDRQLLFAPSGSWSMAEKSRFPQFCEQLRLLRWVLALDVELMPLAHKPVPDSRLAAGLLEPEPPCVRRQTAVERWELRRKRDIALNYAARIVSELHKRGMIEGGLPKPVLAPQADLGASTDLLVNAKTISELDNADLQSLAFTALARLRYTMYVMDILETKKIVSFGIWSRANP